MAMLLLLIAIRSGVSPSKFSAWTRGVEDVIPVVESFAFQKGLDDVFIAVFACEMQRSVEAQVQGLGIASAF